MSNVYFHFDAAALDASIAGGVLNLTPPTFDGPLFSDDALQAAEEAGLPASVVEAVHAEAVDILNRQLLDAALRKARV